MDHDDNSWLKDKISAFKEPDIISKYTNKDEQTAGADVQKTDKQGQSRVSGKNDAQGEASIRDMSQKVLWGPDDLARRKIIYPGMQQREVLNAFREIRAKLLLKTKSKNGVLLVSSVGRSGGSSFSAINLATAFALDEQKTALYIDCSLHSDQGYQFVAEEPGYGLIDYLENDQLTLDDVLYSSGVPRLRIIPGGEPRETAAEHFNSSRMGDLIREVHSRYEDRFVVLDAPSVSVSAEARILSQYCDSAILVVPFGQVVSSQVLAGIDAVGKERFAGVVFNN